MIGKTPNARLAPLYRYLNCHIDGYKGRGVFYIKCVSRDFLAGLCFEPTVLGQELRWLQFFVQPLYVPDSNVTLPWGWRIPKNSGPGLDSLTVEVVPSGFAKTLEVVKNDALPTIDLLTSYGGFLHALETIPRFKRYGIHHTEAYFTTLLAEGRYDDALKATIEIEGSVDLAGPFSVSHTTHERKLLTGQIIQQSFPERFEQYTSLLRQGETERIEQELSRCREEMIERFQIRDLCDS